MTRATRMRHEFVEYIPDQLEGDTLYIALAFATAVHKCACGCGSEVVTPLSPTDWSLKYDGETISLFPSIGNWSFPCQSHYWIVRGRVRTARRWSTAEIEEARAAARMRQQEARRRGKSDGVW